MQYGYECTFLVQISSVMGKNQHVVPMNSGWGVLPEGEKSITAWYPTQADAIEYAIKKAKEERSELLVHGEDGKITSRNSYGNDPYPPKG